MDWDKLRIFHIVAESGSFTRAGDVLNLSQSAVSRQIRGLEEDVGAPLFHRHPRGLILTEEGEHLFEATNAISREVTAANARIRDSRDDVGGDLRITTEHGIDPEKIDKGCLILNSHEKTGYYVLTFDRAGRIGQGDPG